MSRFRIEHPSRTDLFAVAGVDHAVGPFFVELYKEGRSKPIKSIDRFTLGRAVVLNDIFAFLIEHEFFTRDQLEAALVWLHDGGRRPRSRGVVRVVGIVMQMKAGAS